MAENCKLLISDDGIIINSKASLINLSHQKAYIFAEILVSGDDLTSIKYQYYNPVDKVTRLVGTIDDETTLSGLKCSLIGDDESIISKIRRYANSLPSDELSIIVNQYENYVDGTFLDGVLAGIVGYLVFLHLLETPIFVNQLPFQFNIPFRANSGLIVNRNMFNYLSLILTSLIRSTSGLLQHFTSFIQEFINIWEPMFTDGPVIGVSNETRMCLEVITGFSHHLTRKASSMKSDQDDVNNSIGAIEKRLQSMVDQAINRMRRDMNNLVIDTQKSISSLHAELSDERLRARVAAQVRDTVKSEFEAQINATVTEKVNTLVTAQVNTLVTEKLNSLATEATKAVRPTVSRVIEKPQVEVKTETKTETKTEVKPEANVGRRRFRTRQK